MDRDWVELARKAKDEDCIAELLSELDPLLFVIATRLIGRLSAVDDLVQVARIKIWKSLKKIDFDRPETVRQLLITTGVNAMRDEIRSIRCKFSPTQSNVDWEEFARTLSGLPKSTGLFNGLLLEYEGYIKKTGGFYGAHKHFAKEYKISLWTMRLKFHIVVKKYIEDLNK